MQLHRHAEAGAYLHQRGLRAPELIEHMQIGYAPGGCLRGWLTQVGYSLPALRQAGLVTAGGYDAYMRRIVFPWKEISTAAAFRPRLRLTGFCRAPKAVCMRGNRFGVCRN